MLDRISLVYFWGGGDKLRMCFVVGLNVSAQSWGSNDHLQTMVYVASVSRRAGCWSVAGLLCYQRRNATWQKCFNHQSWLTTVICKLTRIRDKANSDQAAKKQLNYVISIHLYRRCHFHWIKGYNENVKVWLYFLLPCFLSCYIWVRYTIITSPYKNVHNGHYSPKRNILRRRTSISIK